MEYAPAFLGLPPPHMLRRRSIRPHHSNADINRSHNQSSASESESRPRMASPRETREAGAVLEVCAMPEVDAFHTATIRALLSRS